MVLRKCIFGDLDGFFVNCMGKVLCVFFNVTFLRYEPCTFNSLFTSIITSIVPINRI